MAAAELENWSQYVGMYRGSYLDVFGMSDEANEIARMICARRDLWKQNQSHAVASMVCDLLSEIDGQR